MKQDKRAKSLIALTGGGFTLPAPAMDRPAVTGVRRASRQPALY